MTHFSALSKYFLFACILSSTVLAKPKTVIYWGQESDGKEQPLRTYCASGNYDIIVMGFAYEFPTPSTHDSAYPALNFASHCETPHDDANPQLLICPGIATDITYCQSLGVQIIMSFGGGVGRYGFSSDAQATTFATLVWNMFFEGTGAIRPFGTAIIDGVDLDIEGGGTTGYVAFINKLRSYYATSQRTYVITSAPQCVYPDGRLGPGAGTALGGAWMDYVFVQFYNNYCGLEFMPYLTVPNYNFNVWAAWARTGSANPNVKVFIGAPASTRAVGAGFVDPTKLQAYAASAMSLYPDVYGGIMLWDASNSDNNNNFGAVVSAIVKAQAGVTVSAPSTPTTPVTTTTTSSTTGIAQARTTTTTTGMAAGSTTTTTTGVAQAASTSTSTTTGRSPVSSTTTTGRSTSTTTGRSTSITTGVAQAVSTSTSSKVPVSVAPVPVATVPVATVPTPAPVPTQTSTTCSSNYMRCLTSETYTMCSHGSWGAAQSCQQGLTCKSQGDYIYCL